MQGTRGGDGHTMWKAATYATQWLAHGVHVAPAALPLGRIFSAHAAARTDVIDHMLDAHKTVEQPPS